MHTYGRRHINTGNAVKTLLDGKGGEAPWAHIYIHSDDSGFPKSGHRFHGNLWIGSKPSVEDIVSDRSYLGRGGRGKMWRVSMALDRWQVGWV